MPRVVPLLASLVLAAAGCFSGPEDSDFDESVDFTRFATYDLLPPRPDVPGARPLPGALREALSAALERRGLRRDPAKPALFLAAFTNEEERAALAAYGRRSPWAAWYGGGVAVHDPPEGALVVDLVDVARLGLVWRGVIPPPRFRADLPPREIDALLDTLFADFPPGAAPR